jgi:2-hydroxycyclohexanecarboxyl-CoA dehydrogenase
MTSKPRMAGKAAIITGGGGGIGAATGQLFCREGGSVLLFDRNREILVKTAEKIRSAVAGAKVEIAVGDVTDVAHAQAAVQQAERAFGRLDVVVSNAAIRYLNPVATADTKRWEELYAVNVLGAVNFSKAALPILRKQKGASIVLVSSCYAVMGRKNFGAYDASKAALLATTRTLAWEEAEHGVRANAVCPGGTLTPFTVGRAAAARGVTEEKLREEPKPENLMNRWGEVDEIAYPILWLASEEASYVTGAVIMVDGGTTIM